jgi:hypothetical protein
LYRNNRKTTKCKCKKTIKISRNFTNIQCHAILIFYSVYQLYIKLVDSWASTIKRTSAVPETSIESVLRLKSSLLPFRCLMLLFVSLNSVQKGGLPNCFYRIIEVVFYLRRISCGKNEGKLLSNWWPPSWIRLGYKANSKKWAQNIILLPVCLRRTLSINIAKNNTYVEQVMPKLFGWCQTVFTELHSYLIPARGNGVPPRLILAGGTPFPWEKMWGDGVPPGKHHWPGLKKQCLPSA